MTDPRIHPGTALQQMLDNGTVTMQQLGRAGLASQFVLDFCRRYSDLSINPESPTTTALARATGRSADYWVELQKAWDERCRQAYTAARNR